MSSTRYDWIEPEPPREPSPSAPSVDVVGVLVWCFLAFAGGALFAALWTVGR